MRFLILVTLFGVVLISCNRHSKYISKKDYGQDWPFTVSSGVVECVGEEYAIIFTADGKHYAINDAAREIGQYESVEEILKTDENYPGQRVKMDVSGIEFEGLKLCDHQVD